MDSKIESAAVLAAAVKGDLIAFEALYRQFSPRIYGLCLRLTGLRLSTVSGDVNIAAQNAHTIEAKSISGDLRVTGGSGEVDVTTVSGNAQVSLATLNRGRFKSISGDLTATFAVSPEAQIDGQSVSGAIRLDFSSTPPAEFDVQSFSGDIDNCFGPKAVQSKYGPGSRLSFKNGDGHAHVRIETQSGDVKLCDKGAPHAADASNDARQAMAPSAQAMPVSGMAHPNTIYII